MAGSYSHITTKKGKFQGVELLDNLGDAYEALEECYGMIWYLADGDPARVREAQFWWDIGIRKSPGVKHG